VTLACSAVAFADAPLPAAARVERWSANRQFVAIADPQRGAVSIYRVEGRNRSELWSISPWERSFHLSNDGESLVVCYSGLNMVPLDYEPSWTMLQFYRRGVLVRKWTLGELVPDLSKLKRTASHHYWGNCAGFDSAGGFRVITVGQGSLRFDVRTGSLVE
jgi:hypothetical protein